MVQGKPRHSQSQGSVERANQDIENMLSTWMTDNQTNKWSDGLRFIQFMKNKSFHRGIQRSPYEAMFGCPPKVGLRSSQLPTEILSSLNSEEDLTAVLDEIAGRNSSVDTPAPSTSMTITASSTSYAQAVSYPAIPAPVAPAPAISYHHPVSRAPIAPAPAISSHHPATPTPAAPVSAPAPTSAPVPPRVPPLRPTFSLLSTPLRSALWSDVSSVPSSPLRVNVASSLRPVVSVESRPLEPAQVRCASSPFRPDSLSFRQVTPLTSTLAQSIAQPALPSPMRLVAPSSILPPL